jgi:hypothetical protein
MGEDVRWREHVEVHPYRDHFSSLSCRTKEEENRMRYDFEDICEVVGKVLFFIFAVVGIGILIEVGVIVYARAIKGCFLE